MIQYRHATKEDIATIITLARIKYDRCNVAALFGADLDTTTLEQYMETLISVPRGCVLCAVRSGQLAGCLAGTVIHSALNYNHLIAMESWRQIFPGHEGHCIGKGLVSRFEAWAVTTGASTVQITEVGAYLAPSKTLAQWARRQGYRYMETRYTKEI